MHPKKPMLTIMLTASRRLRREMTNAEEILWDRLRNRQLVGAKFRRQHVVGWYIANFYCQEYRLIIELDGDIHRDRSLKAHDETRQANLEIEGYHVLRFHNDQVEHDLDRVLNTIRNWIEKASS
jgi:very-short-patch-repair endonuclease